MRSVACGNAIASRINKSGNAFATDDNEHSECDASDV